MERECGDVDMVCYSIRMPTLSKSMKQKIGVFYRLNSLRMPPIFCHINTQLRQDTYLKEPLGKRQCLARYFTNLASATFGTERERGDADMCPVWAFGFYQMAVRSRTFSNSLLPEKCGKLYLNSVDKDGTVREMPVCRNYCKESFYIHGIL